MDDWPILVKKLVVLQEMTWIVEVDESAAMFFARMRRRYNPYDYIATHRPKPTPEEMEGKKVKFDEDF